jgi:hypothetical protein
MIRIEVPQGAENCAMVVTEMDKAHRLGLTASAHTHTRHAHTHTISLSTDELDQTPSVRDGLPKQTEDDLRVWCCQFIQDTGKLRIHIRIHIHIHILTPAQGDLKLTRARSHIRTQSRSLCTHSVRTRMLEQ